jgi:hypothetical protein
MICPALVSQVYYWPASFNVVQPKVLNFHAIKMLETKSGDNLTKAGIYLEKARICLMILEN